MMTCENCAHEKRRRASAEGNATAVTRLNKIYIERVKRLEAVVLAFMEAADMAKDLNFVIPYKRAEAILKEGDSR